MTVYTNQIVNGDWLLELTDYYTKWLKFNHVIILQVS